MHLQIIGSLQSEEDLLQLVHLKNLQHINLKKAENFTDQVAERLLGEETTITEAILLRCPRFTDDGLFRLSTELKVATFSLPKLEKVYLPYLCHDIGFAYCRRAITGT